MKSCMLVLLGFVLGILLFGYVHPVHAQTPQGGAACVTGIEINGKVYTGKIILRVISPNQQMTWDAQTSDDGSTLLFLTQWPPVNTTK